MAGLAKFNFSIEQLYPAAGPLRINTCGNPDCVNFGHLPNFGHKLLPQRNRACPTRKAIRTAQQRRPGRYILAGGNNDHPRVSTAFEFAADPHEWQDQRKLRCLAMLRNGTICKNGFQILSEDHLGAEIDRLRNQNGVLDGPACGCCGRRFLAAPEEFSMNGAHQRTKTRTGETISRSAIPKSVRVIHKPCKGKPGARIAISVPHVRQKGTEDNLRILHALLNSAGVLDVQRMIGAAARGQKIGISRIYDRIAWFEQVFLAYEREMLRRWREKIEASGKPVTHRLSHDDLVLTVNWETATDRRNTKLNCSVTADATSGYVYRIDVDFDPRARPLDIFNETYLDANGMPANLRREYRRKSRKKPETAPFFGWQRPTGRFHESQFFAACRNELIAFQKTAMRKLPRQDAADRQVRQDLRDRIAHDMEQIRVIAEDWFGFVGDNGDLRGSFRGSTTRDIYTKAAHFFLIREMLPPGQIILTTEQEATLPGILPHVFEQEIRDNRFVWLMMTFDKKAKKPDILRKVKGYRKDRWQFYNDGMYDGRFTEKTKPAVVTKAYIAATMTVATSPAGGPFPISNFHGSAFPQLWLRAPTQSSGEIDKVVGFPIVAPWLRHRLKVLPFNPTVLDDELREDLAEHVWNATLQPASTFMNSIRQRLSSAPRAEAGGARLKGTYVQDAVYNPKTLISLLNIFRVHYNYFEPRAYATPWAEGMDTGAKAGKTRNLKYPGTEDVIAVPQTMRHRPIRRTPAMRHGIEAYVRGAKGDKAVPNLYRLIYRPWLYANTKVGTKLNRSRKDPKPAEMRPT